MIVLWSCPCLPIQYHLSSIAQALDRWRGGDRVEVLRSEFLDVLASVPDPRDPRGRRYPLDGLLAIAILATAAGMGSYAGFATWAATAPIEVLAQLGIRFRRPTEKTFRAVFQRLDPADLDRRLGAYFTALAATEAAGMLAVALDGKTLRGARRAGAAAAHLVSVFAHRARLVLGQLAVAEKSNEIPCVRKILHPFRQVRLLVTVDAMHTQTATAKLICGTLKSHYLMIVKSNQPKLLARITALPWTRVPVTATDDAHGHGRVERRTLKVLTAARGIGFPYARQIIQITRERVTAHRRTHPGGRLRNLQPPIRTRPAGDDRRLAARPLGHREHCPLGPRRDLRRGPLHRAHRHRPTGHGQPAKHSYEHAPPHRSRQHRRSLPGHRLQGRPRPRPAHRPPNQQVTSVLVNNAGALSLDPPNPYV